MKRSHGSGHLYVKWGAYYVRRRAVDGRRRNRRVGKVRTRGDKDGLARSEAERAARRLMETVDATPPRESPAPRPTVDRLRSLLSSCRAGEKGSRKAV
jgi:hypothetical protein